MRILPITLLLGATVGCDDRGGASGHRASIDGAATEKSAEPLVAPTILRLLRMRSEFSTTSLDGSIRYLTKVFCGGPKTAVHPSWIDSADIGVLYPSVELSSVRAIVGCGQFQTLTGERPCGEEFSRRGRCVASPAAVD